MTEFNAILKRAFAEALEPADDGFSAATARRVARRENTAKLRTAAHSAGLAVAAAAAAYGLWGLAASMGGAELAASAEFELSRAYGALSAAPSLAEAVLQAFGVGLSQIMLAAAVLAGGAVAFRTAQD